MNFVKLIKKTTKQSGFHVTFKTADLQDIIYTTLANGITVNFDILFSFKIFSLDAPILIPDAETRMMFNDSIKNSFTLSFDSRTSDRKTVDT